MSKRSLYRETYYAEVSDVIFDGALWDPYDELESTLQDLDGDTRPDLTFTAK